jgi:antitoxin (DNA-binding transcriptional repressor) of toxin-antitoxin stability system
MNIKLREFQHHAAKYIKMLNEGDITLTQYNIPVAKVVAIHKVSGKTTEEKPWTQVTRCEYQMCRKDSIGNFSIETYSTDTGDQTITKHLCKLHKHLASKEGKVTQI